MRRSLAVPDLSGRGPLGLKAEKTAAKPRRSIPKQSPKKRAHKAAEKAAGALEHMRSVKALPCVCCGAPGPSEAHHVRCDQRPRSDFRVIPLCYACHRGPTGYHAAKRAWRAMHGRDCDLLPKVAEWLDARR